MQQGSPKALTRKSWTSRENVQTVPDHPKRAPGKKDTKKWCGGHVGREHQPEWRLGYFSYNTPQAIHGELKCLRKVLESIDCPEPQPHPRSVRMKYHEQRHCKVCGKCLGFDDENRRELDRERTLYWIGELERRYDELTWGFYWKTKRGSGYFMRS